LPDKKLKYFLSAVWETVYLITEKNIYNLLNNNIIQ